MNQNRDLPTISIIISCHNEMHAIEEALKSIFNQERIDQQIEIIAASNGSTDGTDEILSQYQIRRLILKENYYSGVLHNAAASIATGEVLFFIDGHMLLESNAVLEVQKTLADESLAGVCGYYASPEHTPIIESVRDLRYHAKARKVAYQELSVFTLQTFHTMSGNLFAIRKKAFDAVGGFDITFKRDACEDNFLTLKLYNAQYKLAYNPKIRATHYHLHSGVMSFLWRGAVWEPRGLTKFLQRAVDSQSNVVCDKYVIQVPLFTTGGLIASLIVALFRRRFVGWLSIFSVLQAIELYPFFTAGPSRYKRSVRFLAAGYWLYVNVFRLLWTMCAGLVWLVPSGAHQEVRGTLFEADGRSSSFERTLSVAYQMNRGVLNKRARFWRICVSLALSPVVNLGMGLRKALVDVRTAGGGLNDSGRH